MTLLVDTNVLVYAGGDPSHPLARSARALVRDIGLGLVRATTTPEVLQEFLHVFARRRDRTDARQRCERFAALLSPLLVVDERTILLAAELFEQRPSIDAFDAVLLAAVRGNDDLELVTADSAVLGQRDVATRSLDSFT